MTRINSYFSGTQKEFLSVIPEETIDMAIQLLSLNPRKIIQEIKLPKEKYKITLKKALWNDIATAIRFHNRPPATRSGSNPQAQKQHIYKLQQQITAGLEALRTLDYKNMEQKGSGSADFKVGQRLRRYSQNSGKAKFSDGFFIQLKEPDGEYPELYPIDSIIKIAEQSLSEIDTILHKIEKEKIIIKDKPFFLCHSSMTI